MRFPIIELDISQYISLVKELIEKKDCHVFIDTNILSQLFKLSGDARENFYSWVDSCSERFHIPNWVVMEYNKHVYSNRLSEYVDELSEAKIIAAKLEMLQKFFRGYVDKEELSGTVYQDDLDSLLNDMININEKYSKITSAVLSKKSEHIKKVQKEINERLKTKVIDTDIYSVIGNLYFEYQLRLDCKVPPGFEDKNKPTNNIGDLIIWNEILRFCKDKNVKKMVFVTRDAKPDMFYLPEVRILADHRTNEQLKVAHESLIYEFKLNSGGSEDCYLINFYTLVNLLSDRYRDLAFSFQLVSRDSSQSTDEVIPSGIEITNENCEQESSEPIEAVPAQEQKEGVDKYSEVALKDVNYLEHCTNNELHQCIERLRSHNWYTQNDAIDDLYPLLKKSWKDSQEIKDAFFVIGRNILQSAEGNAFEACRFIERMGEILHDKQNVLQSAIVDGCLYEVFFDSNNELRQSGFKSRYFKELVREANKLEIDKPFEFINTALKSTDGKFAPLVGVDKNYTFKFVIKDPENELDFPHTLSLEIDDKDVSDTFTRSYESRFAEKDELKEKLSQRYAVPTKNIKLEGVPDGINYIYFIKKENEEDDFAQALAAIED